MPRTSAPSSPAVTDQRPPRPPDRDRAPAPVDERAGERRIVVVGFGGIQSLDLVGPWEVFATADRLATAGPRYRLELAAAGGEPFTSWSGLSFGHTADLGRLRGPIDTLVVVGGDGTREAVVDERLLAGIRRVAPRCRRVTSVCSGAFLLAAAGLLDGRRATTHWSWVDAMATSFPEVQVEADPIFVRDGDVWTSAGVTAGIDLALALVEDDHGPDVARAVARQLVVYLQRPGGQHQFSAPLALQAADRPALRDLQAWIREHVADDCTVPALARQAGMSERTLARAFRTECGTTPADYVEQVRVEAARQLLETTDLTVAAVAARCGFGTPETLHRAFRRRTGSTPAAHRARFRATA